jgi:hypothetical protein
MTDKIAKFLEGIDYDRREAIKKLLMGTAFVAPVAVTFGLGGSAAASSGCPSGPITGQGVPPPPFAFFANTNANAPGKPVPANTAVEVHNPNCGPD